MEGIVKKLFFIFLLVSLLLDSFFGGEFGDNSEWFINLLIFDVLFKLDVEFIFFLDKLLYGYVFLENMKGKLLIGILWDFGGLFVILEIWGVFFLVGLLVYGIVLVLEGKFFVEGVNLIFVLLLWCIFVLFKVIWRIFFGVLLVVWMLGLKEFCWWSDWYIIFLLYSVWL